jgi:agmatine deiminase
MHIPDDPLYYEKFYFAPGDTGFRAWKTRFGRIGVLICWDQWYPEAARLTALQGAEILFYPTAIGWHPREKSEARRGPARRLGDDPALPRRGQRLLRGRVQPDRAERPAGGAGIEFWGQSFVAGTSGQVLARAGVEAGGPPRPGRPRRGRRHAHALAVPARPQDRRLRRPDEALQRLGARAMRAAPRRPAALGFRMPAEWERQEAVWLSWPHNRATWPGNFRPIPAKFAEIAAHISRREKVRINVAPRLAPARPLADRRAGADMANVEFFDHPTNDAWCRDHGPIFVRNDRTGEVALTDWVFNAWGGKYPPFDLDNRIPGRIARALGLRRFESADGARGRLDRRQRGGLLLTTEACLLNPNRNPGLTARQIERNLQGLPRRAHGPLAGRGDRGDDTDGHVDDLARFFSETGIVTAVERDPRDPNHRALARTWSACAPCGRPPGPVQHRRAADARARAGTRGRRLPASYANFLVINGAVLMPAFRQPRRDREAAEVLASCFPGREVVPIDCLELVWGLGTLHCISQQQPASNP